MRTLGEAAGPRKLRAALRYILALVVLVCAYPQQRDFLSDDEGDQIRVAQEPNERLLLYLKFARLRLELVKQAIAVEKPGRSKLIHNNLEDYNHIIEAMDAVIDDALARKVDVAKGVGQVAEREKEFLAMLQEFSSKPAKDRHLFDFALKDALDATQDSLEESQHDLKERAHRVLDEDTRERKQREASMTPAEVEKRKVEEKQAEVKAKKTPKAPTLRRKGEVPKEP